MRGFGRLLGVLWTLARFRVSLPYVRWLLYCFPSYYSSRAHLAQQLSLPNRLSQAFASLGPVWVKVGQLLSTRYDWLPSSWLQALRGLQDDLAPVLSPKEAEKHVACVLGQPWVDACRVFEAKPLASASIAQVHGAVICDQEGLLHEVIVKLVKPGVARQIAKDICLLKTVSRWAQWIIKDSARLRLDEVVDEVERTLLQELDLKREAANASTLKRAFIDGDALYVPQVYWDFCAKDVMVQERISGIRIDDVAALETAGVDLKALAEQGLILFFKQVFEAHFFHADMHPGNVWVQVEAGAVRYAVVDFGIMGTLNAQDQRYIAENLLAFFKRDYRRVAQLHVHSGWVPDTVSLDAFEAAIRTVCEPIFAKPLKDISFGLLLLELFAVARAFDLIVQPQLLLLQKTLVQVEALGRRVYPDLDLWQTAEPFLSKWVASQMGFSGFWAKSRAKWPIWLERLPDLPEQISALLARPPSPPPVPDKHPSVLGAVILGVALGASIMWWYTQGGL